jgi:hypothetical protein
VARLRTAPPSAPTRGSPSQRTKASQRSASATDGDAPPTAASPRPGAIQSSADTGCFRAGISFPLMGLPFASSRPSARPRTTSTRATARRHPMLPKIDPGARQGRRTGTLSVGWRTTRRRCTERSLASPRSTRCKSCARSSGTARGPGSWSKRGARRCGISIPTAAAPATRGKPSGPATSCSSCRTLSRRLARTLPRRSSTRGAASAAGSGRRAPRWRPRSRSPPCRSARRQTLLGRLRLPRRVGAPLAAPVSIPPQPRHLLPRPARGARCRRRRGVAFRHPSRRARLASPRALPRAPPSRRAPTLAPRDARAPVLPSRPARPAVAHPVAPGPASPAIRGRHRRRPALEEAAQGRARHATLREDRWVECLAIYRRHPHQFALRQGPHRLAHPQSRQVAGIPLTMRSRTAAARRPPATLGRLVSRPLAVLLLPPPRPRQLPRRRRQFRRKGRRRAV